MLAQGVLLDKAMSHHRLQEQNRTPFPSCVWDQSLRKAEETSGIPKDRWGKIFLWDIPMVSGIYIVFLPQAFHTQPDLLALVSILSCKPARKAQWDETSGKFAQILLWNIFNSSFNEK